MWAPIGRPSADMAVRLQRRSSEGPGTASPARSPVRGASAVNDLDAAWARVQARRNTCCLQRLLQYLCCGGARLKSSHQHRVLTDARRYTVLQDYVWLWPYCT